MSVIESSHMCIRLIPKLVCLVFGAFLVLIVMRQPVNAADGFVGEGIVMEINHKKGEIVVLEKYFLLKQSQNLQWVTKFTDGDGKALAFEDFGVQDVVQVKATAISGDRYTLNELKMLVDNPSPVQEVLEDKEPKATGGSQGLHLEDGVWKNS